MKVTGIWTTLSANWVKLCHDSLTYSMRRNCYAQDTSPGKALFSTLGIVALFNHANTHGRKCVMTHSLFSLSLLQTYLLNFITLCQSVTFYPNYKLICILQHMLQCHFSRLCLHLLRQELHRFRYFVPRVGDRVWLWGAGECRKMCGEDKKLWSGWKLSGFQVWLYMTRRGLQHHSPQLLQSLHLAASVPGDPEGTDYTITDSSCPEGRYQLVSRGWWATWLPGIWWCGYRRNLRES